MQSQKPQTHGNLFASDSQVAGLTDLCDHTWLLFILIVIYCSSRVSYNNYLTLIYANHLHKLALMLILYS